MDAPRRMREVFIHQDSARVGLYKSILDEAGIPNFVRNGISNNSVTDMPSPVFFPALCVMNDEDYDTALELLRTVHKPKPTDAPDWKCPACAEDVPGNFDTCWKCGREKDAAAPTSPEPAPAVGVAPREEHAPAPAPAGLGASSRTINAFRLLVVAVFVWSLVGSIVVGVNDLPQTMLCIPVAKAFPLYMSGESWEELSFLLEKIRFGLIVTGGVLCFFLSPYGRVCLFLSAVLYYVQLNGGRRLLHSPAASPWWYATVAVEVVALALLLSRTYRPPLLDHFSRK
jgi:hypothetical protein